MFASIVKLTASVRANAKAEVLAICLNQSNFLMVLLSFRDDPQANNRGQAQTPSNQP